MELNVTNRPPIDEGPFDAYVCVAVHGAMDRATSFRRVSNCLLDWGMVTYDRRGYAGSYGLPVSDDFAQQVADLVDVVRTNVEEGRPVVAFGHSYGGNVVLTTAATHPDLFTAAVIYEAPGLLGPQRPSRLASDVSPPDQAEQVFRRLAGDHVWENLTPDVQEQRRAEGETLVHDSDALRSAAPLDTAAITIPVIVGYGGASSSVAADSARQLAGALPHATLVEVPGAGHNIHVGNPTALADLVRSAASLALESGK